MSSNALTFAQRLVYRPVALLCIFLLSTDGSLIPHGHQADSAGRKVEPTSLVLSRVAAEVFESGEHAKNRNGTSTASSIGATSTRKVGVGHGWPSAPPITHAWMPGAQQAQPLLPAYDIGGSPAKTANHVVSRPSETGERSQAHSSTIPSERRSPPQSVDIDSRMPYGGVEPFGQEDTASDLTSSSIREGDAMVDQLEVAEGAEEKRAVFRALTHLRGAEISAYDGIAKGHMSNIDSYNSGKSWRETHPVQHLAEEEDNFDMWAFKAGNSSADGPAASPAAVAAASPAAALLERVGIHRARVKSADFAPKF